MGAVRVLVGTKKGAFVITSDENRQNWQVNGPFFGGWEIYHIKGSPVNPNRIYAAQATEWFGQIVHRSDDGGETWDTVGNEFVYEGEAGTHQWYDGTPHPWEFKRVWHFEPSLTDPDTIYAGVEDAAIFKSTDGGETWKELPGLRRHATGSTWQPGAGAQTHDISFGTQSPGQFQGNQTAATFRPDPLEAQKTYYWRIDEVNIHGKTTGSVWQFTCLPAR